MALIASRFSARAASAIEQLCLPPNEAVFGRRPFRLLVARTPIHPGGHLAEELKELGFSAAELARQIDVPVNRVTSIINGQRAITADTALRLGHWFGTSPEFWLNLQSLYELRLARQEIGNRVESLPRLTDRKRKRANDVSRPL
jgi:addiction module HigA family antidote